MSSSILPKTNPNNSPLKPKSSNTAVALLFKPPLRCGCGEDCEGGTRTALTFNSILELSSSSSPLDNTSLTSMPPVFLMVTSWNRLELSEPSFGEEEESVNEDPPIKLVWSNPDEELRQERKKRQHQTTSQTRHLFPPKNTMAPEDPQNNRDGKDKKNKEILTWNNQTTNHRIAFWYRQQWVAGVVVFETESMVHRTDVVVSFHWAQWLHS